MTTSSQHPGDPGPIHDQRTAPRGVLPRRLQTWLMGGLALVILLIILVTGHATPTSRPVAAGRPTDPSALGPDRIQAYQRQLADEEARLRHQLADAAASTRPEPSPETPTSVDARPASDPIADDCRRREYQGLFADNVALSHRSAEAPSYGERALAARAASTPSAGTWTPQDLLLYQALAAQHGAAPPVPPTVGEPVPASAAPTPAHAAPKTVEHGPIRSSDLRQRVVEGTVIETVLITRLDGTFAGPVACLVTTAVYSQDRQRVLIPVGARVLGTATPVQAWGDSRLAVSFHRLVWPDGHSVSLDQFTGLDAVGDTGLRDEVNRHYLEVFGASAAIGALSGLAQYGTTGGLGATTFADEARQAAGAGLATSSGRVLDRYLNRLPTITIREGFRIKVYVTSDLALTADASTGGER